MLSRGAVLFTALIFGCLVNTASADEWRAFWVDAWGAGFMNQSQVETLLGRVGDSNLKGTIRNANCNSVIVQVRRRYDVCYPSGVGEPYMSGLSPSTFNALQAMINAAHDTTGGKKRIEVHCWLVTFATDGGPVYSQHIGTPTGSLTNFDNYWPTRDNAGAETADKAFDPGHPLVLQYIVNVCMDMVNNFDIDGIHYDYIRFTANNQGYNPTSIARYNSRYGLTGQPASTTEQFKQWRRDQVSSVVRQVYARIQKNKPSVKQSGSFVTWNPSPTSSTRAGFMGTRPYYDVYADWDSWMQEGLMDMAVPMTYYNWASLPSDYTRWMNYEKDRHGNRHMIIGPGIYLNSLANAILEIQMTRDPSPAGNYAHGFCGYSYRAPYASGTWAGFSPSLVSQVTTNWADIPDMPWKSAPTKGHMMGTVTIGGTGAWADHAVVNITGPVSRSMYVDGTGFYAFIDLPPGSYNVTASLGGYPDAQATVNVAIGAVTGNMYEQNLVLTLNIAPTISNQPQGRTVAVGSNVTFAVTASGTPPLNYQWLFEGASVGSATDSSYTRANAQLSDTGSYAVIVANAFGSVTSAPAVLTVVANPEPPIISTQPQSTNVLAGQNATFSVIASGTAPLKYQWRFQGANLSGATDSVFTRSNAQSSHSGNYSVVITNAFGNITSQVAVLTVLAPPAITTQPQSATIGAGQDISFSAVVTGTAPLFYQWRFQGSPLAGATGSNLQLSNVTTNQAGGYDLVVTNAYGSVTSQVATLTVGPPSRLELLWRLAPNSRPYLTINSLPFERGMTYNPVTHHVLVARRSGPNVYVLDAETGADLHQLNMTGVTGGQYPLLMIGAGDDGAIYAGNLSTSTGNPQFKLYRWANDNPNTVATIAFSGDPSPGNSQRWGDSLDVRGVGTNTQVIITPRQGSIAALLTTANGLNFTSRTINLTGIPSGHCALGLTFGASNTFWGTTFTNPLREVTFDLAAGTGVTTRLYDNTVVPTPVCPLGVSTSLHMLAGIHVYSPNHLRIYDLTLTNGTPVLIGSVNFASDNVNDTGTGAVDFGSDTVYALDANNGLMAVRIVPGEPVLIPPAITTQPQNVTVGSGQPATFDVSATGSGPLSYQWQWNGYDMPGATGSSWSNPNVQLIDAGGYTVTITNTAGSVTSIVATLTVTLPLMFDGVYSQSSHQISLRGSGTPGNYVVEATSTPFTNWIPLTNVVIGPSGNFEYIDLLTNAPQRFYRVKGQ